MRAAASLAILSLLFILLGCGDGNDDDDDALDCLPNGNIALTISSMTFSATQGGAAPSTQPVDVTFPNGIYPSGNVARMAIGFPAGSTSPTWIDFSTPLILVEPHPVDIFITDTSLAVGTYNATYRFVVGDINNALLGCIDMPVTYNVN